MPFRDRLEWANKLAADGNVVLATLSDAEVVAMETPAQFIAVALADWHVVAESPVPGFYQFLLSHQTEPWWAVYSILGSDIRFRDQNEHTRRTGLRLFADGFILGETQDEFINLFAAANQPFGLLLCEWAFAAIDSDHARNERFILALVPQPGFTQTD